MDDNDEKSELPIHVILGASDYSRDKMETKLIIGQPLEPIAELTTLGWTVMFAGSLMCQINMQPERHPQITKSYVVWMCWVWKTDKKEIN